MHTPDETSDAFCSSGLPTRTVNPVASKIPNTSFAVHTMVHLPSGVCVFRVLSQPNGQGNDAGDDGG